MRNGWVQARRRCRRRFFVDPKHIGMAMAVRTAQAILLKVSKFVGDPEYTDTILLLGGGVVVATTCTH